MIAANLPVKEPLRKEQLIFMETPQKASSSQA